MCIYIYIYQNYGNPFSIFWKNGHRLLMKNSWESWIWAQYLPEKMDGILEYGTNIYQKTGNWFLTIWDQWKSWRSMYEKLESRGGRGGGPKNDKSLKSWHRSNISNSYWIEHNFEKSIEFFWMGVESWYFWIESWWVQNNLQSRSFWWKNGKYDGGISTNLWNPEIF